MEGEGICHKGKCLCLILSNASSLLVYDTLNYFSGQYLYSGLYPTAISSAPFIIKMYFKSLAVHVVVTAKVYIPIHWGPPAHHQFLSSSPISVKLERWRNWSKLLMVLLPNSWIFWYAGFISKRLMPISIWWTPPLCDYPTEVLNILIYYISKKNLLWCWSVAPRLSLSPSSIISLLTHQQVLTQLAIFFFFPMKNDIDDVTLSKHELY